MFVADKTCRKAIISFCLLRSTGDKEKAEAVLPQRKTSNSERLSSLRELPAPVNGFRTKRIRQVETIRKAFPKGRLILATTVFALNMKGTPSIKTGANEIRKNSVVY